MRFERRGGQAPVERVAGDHTAPLAIEAILKAGSYDLGPKSGRIEDPAVWTPAKIAARAKALTGDKGPAGDFSD